MNNRVDLAPLTPADNQEPAVSGGYIIKKDKDSPGDLNFYNPEAAAGFGGQISQVSTSPNRARSPRAQRNWIVQILEPI